MGSLSIVCQTSYSCFKEQLEDQWVFPFQVFCCPSWIRLWAAGIRNLRVASSTTMMCRSPTELKCKSSVLPEILYVQYNVKQEYQGSYP